MISSSFGCLKWEMACSFGRVSGIRSGRMELESREPRFYVVMRSRRSDSAFLLLFSLVTTGIFLAS